MNLSQCVCKSKSESKALSTSTRPRQLFQPHKPSSGVHATILYSPTHFHRSLQLPAHRWPFGLPKNHATQLGVELNARHARGFSVGHAGDG
jgi:hypothetical protein